MVKYNKREDSCKYANEQQDNKIVGIYRKKQKNVGWHQFELMNTDHCNYI